MNEPCSVNIAIYFSKARSFDAYRSKYKNGGFLWRCVTQMLRLCYESWDLSRTSSWRHSEKPAQKKKEEKKSQVGISVFLQTGPFIFSRQTARPRNRLPSALPNSAVALIMTRAKNQSKHSWASQVGGAKRQKRLGAALAQQWYWKKNKNKKSISASLVIPVLRLVSSLFLLLPTETNYFTRSLSSIFISRALQRWGERQMPRFSAWLSPLNRHPPASSFYFCAPPQVCLCCFLLSSAFLFLFSLFFFQTGAEGGSLNARGTLA